jgi:hypothetical protein
MHYAIKLNSNIKSVGYTGTVEARKATNTAAGHALRKALGKTNSNPNISGDDKTRDDRRSYQDFDAMPKPYGKHLGTQHAALLATGEIDSNNLDEVTLKLDNAISALADVEAFAFNENVSKYQAKRSETIAAMVERGQNIISPEDHQYYRESLKDYSFKYCKNQITIILWSDTSFCDSCMYDDKRAVFVKIIKGKTIFTKDLISPTELKRVEVSTETKSSLRSNGVTTTSMIVGKVQKSNSGLYRLVAVHSEPEYINKIKETVKSSLSWLDIDQV